jgi:hypothetical protein
MPPTEHPVPLTDDGACRDQPVIAVTTASAVQMPAAT